MLSDSPWVPILWVALLLPIYSYVVYPGLMIGLGPLLRRMRPGSRPDLHQAPMPQIALVVSAHNEEQHVANLVQTLHQIDYPGILTLYVGSDGSSDGTVDVLQSLASDRVRVFVFPVNRGKASVLNDLVDRTHEPIIAFTDANTRLEPDSLRHLVAHFADSRVGAVCGELVLRANQLGDNVDSLYWRIERMLKASESAVGALLGANGAIYALRRECFVPIRPDTIVDDFCIAMTVAANGRSLVYEPRARALEDAPPLIADEFKRRVRIGIGNYQAFFRHPEYLFGAGIPTGVAYLSHKVLRWFTPHLLALALLANVMLAHWAPYRGLLIAQFGVYALCLVLYWMSGRKGMPRVLRLPAFLAAMNLAFVVAFCRYVSGSYSGSWKRTARV